MTTTASPTAPRTADAVADRLVGAALSAAELMSVYVGERLGWYADLATHGPTTPDEMAARTGTHPRYAREWLEMQAASGLVDVDLTASPPVFALGAEVAEVVLDGDSLAYVGALPRMYAAAFTRMPDLLDAYRTGGGVSWQQFGTDARECQAALNRPWFSRRLGPALASVEDLHTRLSRPGIRVADIGFGGGWSTIALARSYPAASFVGVDVDVESVALARANARDAGVGDRIEFVASDGADLGALGPFDAAFAFECLHDMSRPVDVLSAVRETLRPGASLVVMDEAVADRFSGPADDVDRLMYGFSLFICLPDGMSSQPSAATGTVMRREILERYARQAGFRDTAVLPIADFSFFRFYELTTG